MYAGTVFLAMWEERASQFDNTECRVTHTPLFRFSRSPYAVIWSQWNPSPVVAGNIAAAGAVATSPSPTDSDHVTMLLWMRTTQRPERVRYQLYSNLYSPSVARDSVYFLTNPLTSYSFALSTPKHWVLLTSPDAPLLYATRNTSQLMFEPLVWRSNKSQAFTAFVDGSDVRVVAYQQRQQPEEEQVGTHAQPAQLLEMSIFPAYATPTPSPTPSPSPSPSPGPSATRMATPSPLLTCVRAPPVGFACLNDSWVATSRDALVTGTLHIIHSLTHLRFLPCPHPTASSLTLYSPRLSRSPLLASRALLHSSLSTLSSPRLSRSAPRLSRSPLLSFHTL